MKHLYKFSLLLLAFLLPATATAHDFEVDGIYYIINGNEATVTSSLSYNEYTGDITIPATVTYGGTTYSVSSINNSAFSWCSGLTSITIPNSIISIGDRAFDGCYGMTNIIVASGNPKYDSRNGCNAIIETVTNTLIVGCQNTTIPNSVTSIGDHAFYGCSSLISIEIPISVTSIGDYAFYCCIGLTSVTIPNSVTSIGSGAFIGCCGLTSVTIPNSVTSIGSGAFCSCTSLTSVTIPISVTRIGSSAFENCSSLTSITVDSGNPKYDSRFNCNAIIETDINTLIAGCQNTTIPNSVTAIDDNAFRGCSGMTIINIPNSVITIGGLAFYNCSGLISIDIPNSVTSIGDGAFRYCTSLTTIIVEEGNTKYDSRNNCNAIIETASNKLFAGCMKTIIPNSVASIGYGAFQGSSGLTSVTIPNSVTSIGNFAFYECSGLTNLTIGSGVTTIGTYAFNNCNALETVKCMGTVPPVMERTDCFSTAAYNRATLLVPRNSEATYAAADYWYKFAHIDGWGSAGRGDIDGDGLVSIKDVTFLIDAILNGDHEGIYFESADLNINGCLDIGDVTSLIDELLNGND